MKFILEFAKIRDITITKSKKILKRINKIFVEDERLIFDVFLENIDKHIFLKWNDTEFHPMIDRIKERTRFNSISEFNIFIENVFKSIIPKEINKSINKNFQEYGLYFPKNNFYIIIDINYDDLFKKYTRFYIVTITLSSPNKCKIIEINDDNF